MVAIRTESIPLGAFLKLAGLADTGGEAKALVHGGAVTVNGAPEVRRGRQLHAGDRVQVRGRGSAIVEATAGTPCG
jgi:ribosome-associated protein